MNQSQQPQQMTPEDEALYRKAGEDEANAANDASIQYLQSRVVVLRAEVLRRDARIAELEAELATRQGESQPDVSGTSEGPGPQ